MHQQKRILFVLGDAGRRYYYRHYFSALRDAGFAVADVVGPDALFAALAEEQYDLVVVEQVMPTGVRYRDEPTSNGWATGSFVSRDLQKEHARLSILLICLSQWEQELFAEIFPEKPERIWVINPLDYYPSDLVRYVQRRIITS